MNEKPFYASLTFWGAVIAAATPIASALGYEIPGGGEGLAEEIVTVIGAVLAIVGRFRAKTVITLT